MTQEQVCRPRPDAVRSLPGSARLSAWAGLSGCLPCSRAAWP